MRIPPFHWWRTVFWLIPAIGVYTLVLGAVSLASMIFDRRGHVAHGCARAWSWLILLTTGVRVHASGGDRVVAGRSYVFVSNHQSIYDFPVLITSIPFQLRILAKASLGAFPVIGWHLRYTGHLLVDRARAGRGTLNQVAAMIRRGHSLIVFPEGTRSRDGRVGRFKRGLFLLAIDAGIPVVPVALTGTRHVMLKGRLMTCPGEVGIVLHEPLPTEGLGRADAMRLAERARGIIAATVEAREERTPAKEGHASVEEGGAGAAEEGGAGTAAVRGSRTSAGDGPAVTVDAGSGRGARPAAERGHGGMSE